MIESLIPSYKQYAVTYIEAQIDRIDKAPFKSPDNSVFEVPDKETELKNLKTGMQFLYEQLAKEVKTQENELKGIETS